MQPLTASASVTVDATPQQVYDVVSDITRTGEWSPVCRSAEWVDPGQTGEGAQFLGHNDDGTKQWTTTSTVVSARPGEEFAWEVGKGYVRWGYTMRAVEDGSEDGDRQDGDSDDSGGNDSGSDVTGSPRTELTHSWEVLPALHPFFADKYGDQAQSVLASRADSAHASIPRTLQTLKGIIERQA